MVGPRLPGRPRRISGWTPAFWMRSHEDLMLVNVPSLTRPNGDLAEAVVAGVDPDRLITGDRLDG